MVMVSYLVFSIIDINLPQRKSNVNNYLLINNKILLNIDKFALTIHVNKLVKSHVPLTSR